MSTFACGCPNKTAAGDMIDTEAGHDIQRTDRSGHQERFYQYR